MRSEGSFRARLGTAVVLLCAARVSFALVDVANYDDHPDLKKAKEYDLTVEIKSFYRADGSFDQGRYESYLAGANRELAEQHYLAYLQDVDESFQRAAVYARLGEVFSGIANPSVATSIDKGRAREYFCKALEAEPERIGLPTLQARGFLATDANTNEQRFASYMDYYEWLLSIDEETLKEKALPTRPPRAVPPAELNEMQKKFRARFEAKRPPRPQSSEGGFLSLIKSQAETTARNLVHDAVGRMAVEPQTTLWSKARAIQHLIVLAERFPSASVATRARTELERIASDVANDALSTLTDDVNAKDFEIVTHAVPASQPERESALSNAETDPNHALSAMPTSLDSKETHRAGIFAWCVGFVASAAILLCIARQRVSARLGGETTASS